MSSALSLSLPEPERAGGGQPAGADYQAEQAGRRRLEALIGEAGAGKLAPGQEWALRTIAERVLLRQPQDKLVALEGARTNLEPYQVAAVLQVMGGVRQRFLLADDVGLGKTIEAGMVLAELAARGRADRVLVLCPAPLTSQWEEEMRRRFGFKFHVFDSRALKKARRAAGGQVNPWQYHTRIISSMDFAKQADVLRELSLVDWDLVIIDEAHRMSVQIYGDLTTYTRRYRLGEMVAGRSEALLLLTATPHRGDRAAFLKLVALLDPVLFSDHGESDAAGHLSQMMIRRGKAGLRDAAGRPLFRPRHVRTIPLDFSAAEKELYQAVTDYVREGYNLALGASDRAAGFAMVLLQRRMASSLHALSCSLRCRIQRLSELLKRRETRRALTLLPPSAEDPCDTVDEWLLTFTPRRSDEDLRREIATLEGLLAKALHLGGDTKANALRAFLDGLFGKRPQEKVIIFTEYRDTLDYLRTTALAGLECEVVHGGMSMKERRQALERFRREARVLLCTDAAGEGLNLQFCHVLLNYEMPWNPNRLDQRIGRIHRYGQQRDVHVYNLHVRNTREGLVFERLQEKIEQIEKDLGGRIPDVLGTLLESFDLERLLIDALAADQDPQVTREQLEAELERRRQMVEALEREFLMRCDHFDLDQTQEAIRRGRAGVPGPAEIETLVRGFLARTGGRIADTRRRGVYRLQVPHALRYGRPEVPEIIEYAAFSRQDAVAAEAEESIVLGPMHPLVGEMARQLRAEEVGRVGVTAAGKLGPGALFQFTLPLRDGADQPVSESLVAVFVDLAGQVISPAPAEAVPPDFARRAPPDFGRLRELLDHLPAMASAAAAWAALLAEKEREKIVQKRRREVAILCAEAERHYARKIDGLHSRLEQLSARKAQGEDMLIALRAAHAERQRLQAARAARLQRLRALGTLRLAPPRPLNILLLS